MTYQTRVYLGVTLLASVLLAPWWVTCVVAIAVAALTVPYEILVAGFLLDLLYSAPILSGVSASNMWEIAPYFFVLLMTLIFVASVFLKRFVIFYSPYA